MRERLSRRADRLPPSCHFTMAFPTAGKQRPIGSGCPAGKSLSIRALARRTRAGVAGKIGQ